MKEKEKVIEFWNNASCGEELYLKGLTKTDFENHSKSRYYLEPEIIEFAKFDKFKNLKTLEIGVGLGADHQLLAENSAILTGIDLTERAINFTKKRFELFDLKSDLMVADAENLPFDNESFDCIYSWGVIHHSPNTSKAIEEIYRILKPGGFAKIMIYHKKSIVGFMLWLRYGLLKFNPFVTFDFLYENYLESFGTKAYSKQEAQKLFSKFTIENISTPLNHADLLTSEVGQRHRGVFLKIAKILWPRFILKKFFKNNGLEMLISLKK